MAMEYQKEEQQEKERHIQKQEQIYSKLKHE